MTRHTRDSGVPIDCVRIQKHGLEILISVVDHHKSLPISIFHTEVQER